MAKYKEQVVTGNSSNYFSSIRIENYYNAPAVVEATEKVVTILDNGAVIHTDAGTTTFEFDPEFEFTVVHPVTREQTDKRVKGTEVYNLIQSYLFAKVAENENK